MYRCPNEFRGCFVWRDTATWGDFLADFTQWVRLTVICRVKSLKMLPCKVFSKMPSWKSFQLSIPSLFIIKTPLTPLCELIRFKVSSTSLDIISFPQIDCSLLIASYTRVRNWSVSKPRLSVQSLSAVCCCEFELWIIVHIPIRPLLLCVPCGLCG